MKSITSLLLAAWLALFCPVIMSEDSFQLSAEHFGNLGVTLGKPVPVRQIPVLYAPAKVVIPPAQEFIISASQSGLITRLNAAAGDKVKKGDILARINSSDLLSMQRLYLKARSELALSLLAYQRDKKLLENGVIPERRWQETRSQYNAFFSEADEHRQLLEIAGMSESEITQLSHSHKLSGQLNILSPVSGVVTERMAVAGARVDNLAPLYRIGVLTELWLEIAIPQERMGSVKSGDKVAIENSPVAGQIILLGQSVNPETQTLPARAVVKSGQDTLRPGQKINVQIIHPADHAFKVPNTAIAQNAGISYIFLRIPAGFRVKAVEIIGKQGDESIISGDLAGSEDIAINGTVALKANWLGLGSGE